MLSGSFPKWLVLQLLRRCNLQCRMCYEWGVTGAYTDADRQQFLPLELIKTLIRESTPFRPHFELFGGEPFLYPDLAEVIHLIKKIGSTLHIPTNGTLLERNAMLLVSEKVDLVWVSLDGPALINDVQRGKGVFDKAWQSIRKICEVKQQYRRELPEIGIAFTLTAENCHSIADLFLESIDLDFIDRISIEFVNYINKESHRDYVSFLAQNFGVGTAPYTRGFIKAPSDFTNMDFGSISRQIEQVRQVCIKRHIAFITRPGVTDPKNIAAYFNGKFQKMADKKSHCPLPFLYLEVSTTGEVTPCHAFYDLTVGSVHDSTIQEIWAGERLKQIRAKVKKELLPICTGCCHYYL